MKNEIMGKVYVLGDNIDTDQIIPAEHLVYSTSNPEESKLYGKYALSGVPMDKAGLPKGNIPFIEGNKYKSEFSIIVAGNNFGCGSSREHAPYALQKAGIKAIIANSYARIFYRNSVDGGFLIPFEVKDYIVNEFETGDEVIINIEDSVLSNITKKKTYQLTPLGDVFPIVSAGGLFQYARKESLIKKEES